MVGFMGFSEGDAEEELTVVKLGVSPYFDYQPFTGAHELGLDRELGLELELIPMTSDITGIRAMETGDLDITTGSVDVIVSLVPQAPDLVTYLNICQFKGFQVIGRRGQVKTFDQILEEKGGDWKAAQRAVYAQLEGKTMCIVKVQFEAMVTAMLGNADLTMDDVTVLDFADDAKSGAAFMRGEGDFYVGSLPQQMKMLKEPEFIAVAGSETIGPSGLWFSNSFALKDYVDENPDIILKLAAINYRIIRYMREKPDMVLGKQVDYLNKIAGVNLTVDDAKQIMSDFIDFETWQNSKETVYNSDSPLYWKISVDHYIKHNEDLGNIEKGVVTSDFVIQEEIFNKLLKDKELMDWINKPL
jgi:ABC-type nitrate/sulfonate/bicarbonate transport system substrate-binding protein